MESQLLKIYNYAKGNIRLLLGLLLTLLTINAIFSISTEDPSVCSEQGKLGMCYNIPEDLCVKTWETFEKSCREEAPKMLGREIRKSELIGSFVNRCQHMKYDKIFYYTRKTIGPSSCTVIFDDADAMKKDLGL